MMHAVTMEPANIVGIDSRREKLRCAICPEKLGQKVQCAKGQCRTACHPWCANHNPKGWIKHIRRDSETDSAVFQVYCPKHRNAVKERPIETAARTRTSGGGQNSNKRKQKRRYPGRSSSARPDVRAPNQGSRRSSSTKTRRAIADTLLETDRESSCSDETSMAQTDMRATSDYNVCTFSEWPGQQVCHPNHRRNIPRARFTYINIAPSM